MMKSFQRFRRLLVFLVCLPVVGMAQTVDPSLIDLLNPDGKAADAFDAGWSHRVRAGGGAGTKATGRIEEGSTEIPAVDGERYFRISLKGGDAKRLSGKVSLSGIPVDLARGRRFRLEYWTRVDSKVGPQAVNGALLFRADKDTKSPAEVVTSKSQVIERGEWQKHSTEFVCGATTSAGLLEIRMGFMRWRQDGRTVSADALLDGLRLHQIAGSQGRAELTDRDRTPPPVAPIPIEFTVPQAGKVTLVMESADGTRINNLVEGVFYEKGAPTPFSGTDSISAKRSMERADTPNTNSTTRSSNRAPTRSEDWFTIR